MKHLRSIVVLLLLLSVAAFLINCEQKSSTGPPGGGGSSIIGEISLVANNANLYTITGIPVTATITATVTDTSGSAVTGIIVKFTAPAIGSISTTQDTTDLDGKVTVTFNSQNEFGAATITASVTSGGTTHQQQTTIWVYPLTGLADDIALSLFPITVYQASSADQEIDVEVFVMDSLNVGIPGIHPSLSTTLGSIELVDVTNSAGSVTSLVHTQGDTGTGIVKATVITTLGGGAGLASLPPGVTAKKLSDAELDASGMSSLRGLDEDVFELTATDTFYVKMVNEQITRITAAATPATFEVAPNESGSTTIRATVINVNNVGIPGVQVSFRTDKGTLASGTGTTDSTGTTQITYFSTPNEWGLAWVWASIGAFEDSTTVTVEPTASSSGEISLFTDTYVIWADWGITTAEITAVLKDADDQAIAAVPMIFTSNYGTINSQVLTDTAGIARAVFRDLGSPSFPDSTLITAKYSPLSISTSLKIMIEPALGVESIDLDAGTTSIQANGADSTELNATVRLDNGTLAPAGTTVQFIVAGDNLGDIIPATASIGTSGNAITHYHTGSSTGVDTLYAMVEGVYSDPIVMDLHAGPPSQVDITANPTSVYVNGGEN
ncbi:Ig-like domain-containing protein, partial [bacterium]|nr:Ig-like domain-containing protein [bacterium]